ncbi:hypothetical protein CLV53_1263 [Sediminibacterium magnilacihabitans]|jgi:hypothetical protein|nr:hypothetical protein CLV53_1263 [Sediminibacterium magnilacihabitans]
MSISLNTLLKLRGNNVYNPLNAGFIEPVGNNTFTSCAIVKVDI